MLNEISNIGNNCVDFNLLLDRLKSKIIGQDERKAEMIKTKMDNEKPSEFLIQLRTHVDNFWA